MKENLIKLSELACCPHRWACDFVDSDVCLVCKNFKSCIHYPSNKVVKDDSILSYESNNVKFPKSVAKITDIV